MKINKRDEKRINSKRRENKTKLNNEKRKRKEKRKKDKTSQDKTCNRVKQCNRVTMKEKNNRDFESDMQCHKIPKMHKTKIKYNSMKRNKIK